MRSFSKKGLLTLCCIALVASAISTLAVQTWSQSISWNYIAVNKSFSVSGNTVLNYGDIIGPTTKTESYTVTNDGNVDISVNAVAAPTGLVTTSWDKTSVSIAVGESATFTLALEISGVGSCNVNFALAS